jgi:hypothetical protein
VLKRLKLSPSFKEHKDGHTYHGAFIFYILCSQGNLDDGIDFREAEAKHTASKTSTAKPTKRQFVSEGI